MPIKHALFENNITYDRDDYAAMVQISGSADGDNLVQDIVDRGTTVNKPDILAVTAALKLACQRRVEQGSLDKLCGFMNHGKPVSMVRSVPAPYLAPAPASNWPPQNTDNFEEERMRTGGCAHSIPIISSG